MPSTDAPIGILVAVREELRAILKQTPPPAEEPCGGFVLYRTTLGDVPIVLAKSGMGPDRAARLATAVIRHTKPRAIIAAGFCGGLAPAVHIGAVVVPNRVIVRSRLPRVEEPDGTLLACARAMSPQPLIGAAAAVEAILTRATHKAELVLECPDLVAADMESGAIAAAARAAGVPWLAIRAVSDSVADDLPLDFGRLTGPDGEVSPARIAAATITAPWKIPALIRLGHNSALAGKNLAGFLEDYVRALATAPRIEIPV